MATEQLIGNLVYSEGSHLWVIPDKTTSNWSQTLDWYLNFQIAKAHSFKRPEICDQLQEILQDEEIENIVVPSQDGKPLLIASPKHLPNLMTVVLSFDEKNSEVWLDGIHKTWLELGKPSMRVFLPRQLSESAFLAFSKKNFTGAISFVVER